MIPPNYGRPEVLGDGIRRIIAPNPGPMTHHGTNTWLLGEREVAIIDPAIDDDNHLAAILSATKGQFVSHILVTHTHADHSPLASRLSRVTGAPIYGFGTYEAGRSATMQRLAERSGIGGGEGVDTRFKPDICIGEGAVLSADGWTLDVLHTPGHFAGHLSFRFGETLFSGDHVMDWATSLVSPPDGDLGAFLRTSRRLAELGLKKCLTGHGSPISDPQGRLSWLVDHRRMREEQILRALEAGHSSIQSLVELIRT